MAETTQRLWANKILCSVHPRADRVLFTIVIISSSCFVLTTRITSNWWTRFVGSRVRRAELRNVHLFECLNTKA